MSSETDLAAHVAEENINTLTRFTENLSAGFHLPPAVISLFLCIVIVILAKVAVAVEKKVFHDIERKSKAFSSLGASLVIRIVQIVIWLIALMLMLACWKINLTPVLAGLGVTGMVLGLALQESISSLFCGIMIAVNKPFREGDWIDVGKEASGTVTAMDVMCVTLMTEDNKKVTISNKTVWGSTIVNYSFTEKRRIEFQIGIGYEYDADKAKEAIRKLLESYPEVLKNEPLLVETKSYDSSNIIITARPWVKPSDYWSVYWKFNGDLLKCLHESGIDMSYDVVVVENRS